MSSPALQRAPRCGPRFFQDRCFVGGIALACLLPVICCSCYLNRGNTRYLQRDYVAAIADYNKAIELKPAYDKTYNGRGIAKRASGDFAGAIADCSKAIEINPQNAEAYNNRGNARREMNDFDGAILDYNKALELNPQYAHAYSNRAEAEALKKVMK